MLKFQTDLDEETGEQVLTCFLLPQLEYHPENAAGKYCNQHERFGLLVESVSHMFGTRPSASSYYLHENFAAAENSVKS
jgi:hypothetical protein